MVECEERLECGIFVMYDQVICCYQHKFCLTDESKETHQNVINEAKEQDQSQQKECQAKGDP